MHILIIILFLLVSKISLAGTMTATSSNMDYAMTRSSVPDVLEGLVLNVPLRHSGMSYAQDVSQYQVQGTITGATWATGTARGLYFDGVNDIVNFGDPADGHLDFGTGSFSLCSWFRSNGEVSIVHIIFNKTGGAVATPGYYMNVNNIGSLRMCIKAGSTSTNIDASKGSGITDGNWHYLCGVFDRSADSLLFYKDGTLIGTSSIAAIPDGSSTSSTINLTIGADSPYFTNGYLDNVRIYNRALSNDEVYRIYQVTKH